MMILGQNVYVENSSVENSNTVLIGAPGTGKTRSYVLPNLMSAEEESFVVLDPKGEIYDISANLMREKGYVTRVLDFVNPDNSDVHYNPLHYCHSADDVIKFSSVLVDEQQFQTNDMFWPLSARLLCNALAGFLKDHRPRENHTLKSMMALLNAATITEDNPEANPSRLDRVFNELAAKQPDSWSLSQYNLVRRSAGKTQKSIVISLVVAFCGLLTPQIMQLTSYDDVDLPSLCSQKTVLYVKCSDTDRSKDKLISMFFTQLFQELYCIADNSDTHCLPRPVKVVLDDMGANLHIPNLDGIIATARGRGISLSLILQSIGQLKKQYPDYTSILNSCNNVVFLGGSDIETCQEMAQRLDKPLSSVLYKDMQTIFVFRQGQKPIVTKAYNLKEHPYYMRLNQPYNRPDKRKEEMHL